MSALQLEAAAAVLGPLLEEVVFVGGATIYLWITDPAAPPVRATEDVDVVCEVATRVEYYRFGARLRERGLQEATGEPVLCRWRSMAPKLVLDVMPTNPEILGFSNPWYEEAISTAATIDTDSGAELRAATPPLLVATKLCAWKGRGKGDLLGSLDVHDVLTLFDGRPELTTEIEASDPRLRHFSAPSSPGCRRNRTSTTRSMAPRRHMDHSAGSVPPSSGIGSADSLPERWGKNWGKVPHRFQPVSGDLDSPKPL